MKTFYLFSKVWTPDIFLFNDATGSFSDSLVLDVKVGTYLPMIINGNQWMISKMLQLSHPTLCPWQPSPRGHKRGTRPMDPASSREVDHDSGWTISYFYHEFILRSLCDFDPNSSESEYLQKIFSCNLKFGSWVYNAGQLDIINVGLIKKTDSSLEWFY